VEFTILCPIDGEIQVGVEDMRSVIIRDRERADITFACPHCGTEIGVTAIVPAFLLAAIESLALEEGDGRSGTVFVSREPLAPPVQHVEMGDSLAEAYCEYFRRQLASVETVDDVLDEIDSRSHQR